MFVVNPEFACPVGDLLNTVSMSMSALNCKKMNWFPASPFGSHAVTGNSVGATTGFDGRMWLVRSFSERIDTFSGVGLPSAPGLGIGYGTMTPNPFDIWARSLHEFEPPPPPPPPQAVRARVERPKTASADQ